MAKSITKFTIVAKTNANDFIAELKSTIEEYQGEGLEVEIQYGGIISVPKEMEITKNNLDSINMLEETTYCNTKNILTSINALVIGRITTPDYSVSVEHSGDDVNE